MKMNYNGIKMNYSNLIKLATKFKNKYNLKKQAGDLSIEDLKAKASIELYALRDQIHELLVEKVELNKFVKEYQDRLNAVEETIRSKMLQRKKLMIILSKYPEIKLSDFAL